jgi:hypothetical protein
MLLLSILSEVTGAYEPYSSEVLEALLASLASGLKFYVGSDHSSWLDRLQQLLSV